VDDSRARPGEKSHCVNTLAFIGPQRNEGPGSGPSLLLMDGSVAFERKRLHRNKMGSEVSFGMLNTTLVSHLYSFGVT